MEYTVYLRTGQTVVFCANEFRFTRNGLGGTGLAWKDTDSETDTHLELVEFDQIVCVTSRKTDDYPHQPPNI